MWEPSTQTLTRGTPPTSRPKAGPHGALAPLAGPSARTAPLGPRPQIHDAEAVPPRVKALASRAQD